MVAVIDDAHAFVDVLTDDARTRRDTWDILIITMDAGVVVMQQRVSDVVDMLVVGLTKVSATSTFVLGNALSNRKPSVGGGDISFVVDHLVDLCGDVVDGFGGETADNYIIIVVTTNQLSVVLVGTARIASRRGEVTLHLRIVANEQNVANVGVAVVLALDVVFNGIACEA